MMIPPDWSERYSEYMSTVDNVGKDIYNPDFVESLLDDDELSAKEAAFMNGYDEDLT